MKIVGCLMAAGASSRFKGVKQLAKIGRTTLIEKAVANYKIIFGNDLLVALGANYSQVKLAIDDSVNSLYVSDWENGLGQSISTLINNVAKTDVTHVLLGLADQVAIGPEEIKLLVKAANRNRANIICSSYNDIDGVPAVFPKKYFKELVNLGGDVGAKYVLKRFSDQVVRVELPEAAFDIDTQEDLQSWVNQKEQ